MRFYFDYPVGGNFVTAWLKVLRVPNLIVSHGREKGTGDSATPIIFKVPTIFDLIFTRHRIFINILGAAFESCLSSRPRFTRRTVLPVIQHDRWWMLQILLLSSPAIDAR